MKFNLLHPREQLVTIMQRIYDGGMTTLSGGNLSVRDAEGTIWITPSGVDKGKLTLNDMLCVRTNGDIEGIHQPSSELPFHRAIYTRRPDLKAIVHAHPPALVAFSIAREVPSTHIIPQANRVCGAVGYAPYALPGSEQLGKNIAETFASGCNIVILENHGMAAGGTDLLDAFQRLETLDFCARSLIQAQGLGNIHTLTDEQLRLIDQSDNLLPEFDHIDYTVSELGQRRSIVDIVQRACTRQLMISTEGVVSARVDEDSFLITPTGIDRRSVDLEDLVLIQAGRRERGKVPSRSVRLHQAIYAKQPDINCIITAQSPNITAYAITAVPFDSRSIPESYILLRDMPQIAFGGQYSKISAIAEKVTLQCSVLLIANDCILTAGRSILEAFDRLEVAEFSAHSLIDAARFGQMVPIGDHEIEDLKAAFRLT